MSKLSVRLLFSFFIGFSIARYCFAQDTNIETISIDEIPFQDLYGNPIQISDFRGKRVFLNHWATWCAPCIREIPSIERAEEILRDEAIVFLLASDESIEDINEFVSDHGYKATFIKMNISIAERGIKGMPTSYLYDENGVQIKEWLGEEEWDSEQILAELIE